MCNLGCADQQVFYREVGVSPGAFLVFLGASRSFNIANISKS